MRTLKRMARLEASMRSGADASIEGVEAVGDGALAGTTLPPPEDASSAPRVMRTLIGRGRAECRRVFVVLRETLDQAYFVPLCLVAMALVARVSLLLGVLDDALGDAIGERPGPSVTKRLAAP